MQIIEMIKALREATGASLNDSKWAVDNSDGSYEHALSLLKGRLAAHGADLTLADVIQGASRSDVFLDIPREGWGTLRLDVWDLQFMQTHSGGQMSQAQVEDADSLWELGRRLFNKEAPGPARDAARALTQKYPLYIRGHEAMHDISMFMQQLDDAVYHRCQLAALSPDFQRLGELGRTLGMAKRLKESAAVLEALFAKRAEAPSQEVALAAAFDLTVTLTRLQNGQRLARVAALVLRESGFITRFAYQHVLGFLLAGDKEGARTLYNRYAAHVAAEDPMRPQFAQLGQSL